MDNTRHFYSITAVAGTVWIEPSISIPKPGTHHRLDCLEGSILWTAYSQTTPSGLCPAIDHLRPSIPCQFPFGRRLIYRCSLGPGWTRFFGPILLELRVQPGPSPASAASGSKVPSKQAWHLTAVEIKWSNLWNLWAGLEAANRKTGSCDQAVPRHLFPYALPPESRRRTIEKAWKQMSGHRSWDGRSIIAAPSGLGTWITRSSTSFRH